MRMEERNAEKGLLQEMLEVDLFELKVLKARDLRESAEIIEMISSHLIFFLENQEQKTMGVF